MNEGGGVWPGGHMLGREDERASSPEETLASNFIRFDLSIVHEILIDIFNRVHNYTNLHTRLLYLLQGENIFRGVVDLQQFHGLFLGTQPLPLAHTANRLPKNLGLALTQRFFSKNILARRS